MLGFAYSPDGATLVYVSDERTDDVQELFAVPADGSAAPLVLSGALIADGDVSTPGGLHSGAFALAPDGTWAAYLADSSTDGLFELHRTPIDGSSSPIKLSGALVANGDVTSFQISADGTFVVFLADALTDEQFELFSAPSDGSTVPVRLNSVLVAGGDVSTFALGPLSARAYFLADGALDGVPELHSVPLDATLPAVRLNDALAAGRAVLDFRVAGDESRVAYRADGAADDVIELYGVPADRSAAPVKLSPTPVAGGDVGTSYEIGAARVAYVADQDTNDVNELYSVPLDGSAAATKLHPGSSTVSSFRFTPDGTLVLFSGEIGLDRGLFRVPATGGTPVKLSGTIPASATLHSIEISADGEVCLFVRTTLVISYGGIIGSYENLYCVQVAGGTPRQLTFNSSNSGFLESLGAPQLNADATQAVYVQPINSLYVLSSVATDASSPPVQLAATAAFEPSPSGTHAAFVGDPWSGSATGRLATVSLDGSQALVLSGPVLLGGVQGDVEEFEPTPDGLQVAYRTSYQDGFHVVGVGGGSPSFELKVGNGFLSSTPLADSIVHAPDSRHLAFLAHPRVDGGFDLFAAPLRGPGAPVRVNQPAIDGVGLALYPALRPRFTPDGSRLVYAAGRESYGEGEYALFIAPIDGSLPPTRLNGTGVDAHLWDGGSSSSYKDRAFAVSPDGTRAVYSISGPRGDLFSVPLDASAPPVQLSNLALAATSVYGNWEITPDGARVVYMTDQEVRLRSELYSAPLDGSTPAVKLNPPLVSRGRVGFYGEGYGLFPFVRITPDGTRVVYLADQEVDEQDELYSVPSDGSGTAVKVSGALVSGGDAKAYFQLSPDGTRVVYAADALNDEVVELFVAPLDASAAPLRLSGTLVAGGDVSVLAKRDGLVQFAGGRVVYAADALVNDVVELFSAPLDGSSAPVRLSAPMASGGDVDPDTVLVTADGLTAIYRADQATNDVFELWRVPIDGSAAPVRVNLPLPSGGDVTLRGLRVLERGNRILYLADQEVDEQFELYSLRLLPRTPRGPAVPPPISGTVTRDL